MPGGMGSTGNMRFLKGSLAMSLAVLILLPTFIGIFSAVQSPSISDNMSELMDQYTSITGQEPSGEEIWGLSGIYTPYGQDSNGEYSSAWGRTDDGWVYGQRIQSYTPAQFDQSNTSTINGGKEGYTVYYDAEDSVYRYQSVGADLADSIRTLQTDGDGNVTYKGDLYSSVSFSVDKKSNIFFTEANRTELENGTFYYTFGGTDGGAYRYAFQPLQDYLAVGTSGSATNVDHTKTSLSLIWYVYNSDSGISGQLILSGSESGVSFLTASEIQNSYNGSSYTSKFEMRFNGIDMYIYIQLNPWAVTNGYSPEDCFNAGLWSVMITSPSTSPDVGLNTLSAFSLDNIFDTIIDLLTFDLDKYGFSGTIATLASVFFSLPFYIALVAIAMEYKIVWIFAAIVAAIQAINIF